MPSEYFLRWTMKHRIDICRNWWLMARLYLIHMASLKTCGWTMLQCGPTWSSEIYTPTWLTQRGLLHKKSWRPTSHYKHTTTSITDTYTQCITVRAARTDWLSWKPVLIRARRLRIKTMRHGWYCLRRQGVWRLLTVGAWLGKFLGLEFMCKMLNNSKSWQINIKLPGCVKSAVTLLSFYH